MQPLWKLFGLLAALSASLVAQEAAPAKKLAYSGNPIKINLECTESMAETLDLRCSDSQPCPLFLELSSAASGGGKFFVSGNIHTQETTVSSLLLTSEDGGVTWTEAIERFIGGGLDGIQFIGDSGWVAGQILAPAPAHLPFLLVTADGGLTWTRKMIRGSGSQGLVDSFWFKNSSTGSVLIDNVRKPDEGFRYELFETASGGDSWSVKEYGNRPPADRPVFEPDRYMKLRTDAASKTYVLENKAVSGRSAVLARFSIQAGICRPPRRELGEPPPEPEPEPPPPPAKAKPASSKSKKPKD